MALKVVTFRPGINSIPTPTKNEGGISAGNLIRWRQGLTERIGGWLRLSNNSAGDHIRAMHAYQDLNNNDNLLLGTDAGAELYLNGTFYVFQLARRTGYTDPQVATTTEFNQAVVPTAGSTTVLVHDAANGASTGDTFSFPVQTEIGGFPLAAGVTFTIFSTVNADSWQFNLATAAVSSSATMPQLRQDCTNWTDIVGVYFPSHGLSNGQLFTTELPTTPKLIFPTNEPVTIPAGTYTVSGVTANNFIINYTSVATNPGYSVGSTYITEGFDLRQETSDNLMQSPIVTYFASSQPSNRVSWSVDNLGNNGLFCWFQGPIYVFTPPMIGSSPILSNASSSDAPQINSGMFTAMPQAQVIAFGCSVLLGDLTAGPDPLLLRFSDAGSYSVWTASITNQAGSYRLSRGSKIVGGKQAPQTTLIWTDLDLWSMQYIGPPLVYGFNIIGSGCGLIAMHAAGTLGRITYWMSQKQFFIFDGSVNPLPCPVWDDVFPQINQNEISKIFAAANSAFNEIAWFFPTGANTECDTYVKYNTVEQSWDLGILGRSAWIDQSVFGMPIGADGNFRLQQHETGYNDDASAMDGAYMETAYEEIQDGDYIVFVDFCIPDFKWLGTGGEMQITLYTVSYPADTPRTYGPFTANSATTFIPVRLRGRQVKIRFTWATQTDFNARIGAVRFRVAPAGRRP